jgi:hypothetical protein
LLAPSLRERISQRGPNLEADYNIGRKHKQTGDRAMNHRLIGSSGHRAIAPFWICDFGFSIGILRNPKSVILHVTRYLPLVIASAFFKVSKSIYLLI